MRLTQAQLAYALFALTFANAHRAAADSPAITRTDAVIRETSETVASAARVAPPREPTRRPPLYVEVWPRVHRGPRHGREGHEPFVSDIALHHGDEIELEVRTSGSANVYLLHCDGGGRLSVFPDSGGIPFRADVWVALPAAGMPLRVGATPGAETLYIVASRDPLHIADAALEHRLAQASSESGAASCDPQLETLLTGSDYAPRRAAQPQAAGALPKKPRFALRGIDTSGSAAAIARAFTEDDGIVVLRFAYRNQP